MLLRASSEKSGQSVELHALTEGTAVMPSGVMHGETLGAFAEAMVGNDDEALAVARQRVLTEVGPEALVDATAVASNFERMVRIADSTGIPLDDFVYKNTIDLRKNLSLSRFGSAANTPQA